jgi:hypoxia up-regulated 1
VSWDATLGGQNMEMRLVDHFAAQFKSQTGIDVYKHPKGMAKLKKQVKRTKEILSANTEAGISVESMVEDHDFRQTIFHALHKLEIFFLEQLNRSSLSKLRG